MGYVGMIDTFSLCDNHYEYAEGMEEKWEQEQVM